MKNPVTFAVSKCLNKDEPLLSHHYAGNFSSTSQAVSLLLIYSLKCSHKTKQQTLSRWKKRVIEDTLVVLITTVAPKNSLLYLNFLGRLITSFGAPFPRGSGVSSGSRLCGEADQDANVGPRETKEEQRKQGSEE